MNRFFRSALFPLIVIVLLVYLASQTLMGGDKNEKKATYSEVQGLVRDSPETIQKVTFNPNKRQITVDVKETRRPSRRTTPATSRSWPSSAC